MNLAVIGCEGQLGSDVVEQATAAGHRVTPISHRQIDVSDWQSTNAAISQTGADTVINCAAYVRVDDAEANAEEAFRINAIGALNVARACAAASARCVYVSTDYVFDGAANSPYSEDQATGPINVYGASKLAGEWLTKQAANDWLIVRVASLFGKMGTKNKTGTRGNFIETILSRAREAGKVSVVNDIRISPTYAWDAAEAILGLTERDERGVFHVVNSGACTWFDFANRAIEASGLRVEVVPVTSAKFKTAARRPANSALSPGKAERALGKPMRHWEEALTDYLRVKGHTRREPAR